MNMFLSNDLFNFELNPFENFHKLFQEAQKNGSFDPTAMSLATVDSRGRPHNRIVLLKQTTDEAFVFFTNYLSSKSNDIQENPNVALIFHWAPLAIQIRVEGIAEKVSRSESEEYFNTRPRISQLGAWASKQSEFIESYESLIVRLEKETEKFMNKTIPCPEYWGGYRIKPEVVEFWFGVEGRLHHRYCYERANGPNWLRTMKSP